MFQASNAVLYMHGNLLSEVVAAGSIRSTIASVVVNTDSEIMAAPNDMSNLS